MIFLIFNRLILLLYIYILIYATIVRKLGLMEVVSFMEKNKLSYVLYGIMHSHNRMPSPNYGILI